LLGRPEGKRRRWEDNITADIKEVEGVYLIHPARNRGKWPAVVNKIIDNLVPPIFGNLLYSWGPIRFSGSPMLRGVIYNDESCKSAEKQRM
jgi:hypothetical protein